MNNQTLQAQNSDRNTDHQQTCLMCNNTGKILIGYYNWSSPDMTDSMFENCSYCTSYPLTIIIGDTTKVIDKI